MITQDQIKALDDRIQKLKTYLRIDQKKIEIENEEEKTNIPEFWENQKEAQKVMKYLRGLKRWVEEYTEVSTLFDDLEILIDFFKEGEATEEEITSLYNSIVLFRIVLKHIESP